MLLDKLEALANELDSHYYYINQGGCCVVAAHVAKALQKHMPVRISVSNLCDNYDIDEIRKTLVDTNCKEEWEDNGIDFAHVVAEFMMNDEWHAFDTDHGVMLADEYWQVAECNNRNAGYFTIEEAMALANTDSWNSTFERDQIPSMRWRITYRINQMMK